MIRIFGNKNTIDVGQWFVAYSSQIDGICSQPRQATKVSAGQVYYITRDGTTSFYKKSSIEFVCDTEAESKQLYEISQQQIARIKQVKDECADIIRKMIEAQPQAAEAQ